MRSNCCRAVGKPIRCPSDQSACRTWWRSSIRPKPRKRWAISVVEPNAAGMVTPIGLNSGVDVAAGTGPMPAGWERHRLIFWPRTTTPFLMIANRRDDVPAVFGTLRVLSGPAALPARPAADGEDARLMALYFDRPLLADAFLAGDTLDVGSDRSLTDWVTFLQAGSRFVEYLKHTGHNGAMLAVWHEGGAIYPSAVLQSTPKYDSGLFFGTGQDPIRKDILELLFRLFDREGLTLVPALQFSTPLPELETLRRRQVLPPESVGIELVAADGRTWRQLFAADRAAGPVYNPLSPAVQKAMQRVMLELGQRYGQHRSFGGVAVQLGPQTYAQLPDAQWAQDDTTVRQFATEERLAMAGLGGSDRRVQAMFLAGRRTRALVELACPEAGRLLPSLRPPSWPSWTPAANCTWPVPNCSPIRKSRPR